MSDGVNVELTERLAAIRERCEKATGGKWWWHSENGYLLGLKATRISPWRWLVTWKGTGTDGQGLRVNEEDMAFIAHSREDIPWLLARLAEVTAERDRERETNTKAIDILDKIAKESLRDGIALQEKLRETRATVERLKGERDAAKGETLSTSLQLRAANAQVEQLCGDVKAMQKEYTNARRTQLKAEAELERLREERARLRDALRELLHASPASAFEQQNAIRLAKSVLGADEGRGEG